jgi:dGTPase
MTVSGLLHDIGHPPFGHGGETALNYKMHDWGGFEGNAQTLRLLTRLERYSPYDGLNLTRRSLLSVLKYPNSYEKLVRYELYPDKVPAKNRLIDIDSWKPPKCYYDDDQSVVDWLFQILSPEDKQAFTDFKQKNGNHNKTLHKNLDCSIMDIADDISYAVHDLEDAIHLGLITSDNGGKDISKIIKNYGDPSWQDNKHNQLFSYDHSIQKQAISDFIHYIIFEGVTIENYETIFQHPLLQHQATLKEKPKNFVGDLQDLVKKLLIDSQEVQTIEFGGMMVVMQLFDALESNPTKLLSKYFRNKYKKAHNEPLAQKRIICDYVAGMSDEYAYRMHQRLYGENTRSVFEKI